MAPSSLDSLTWCGGGERFCDVHIKQPDPNHNVLGDRERSVGSHPILQHQCQRYDESCGDVTNNQATATIAKWLASISIFIIVAIAVVTVIRTKPSKTETSLRLGVFGDHPSFAPSTTIKYAYHRSETSKCSTDNESNWQGPNRSSDNTVMKFFAFGDVPYDDDANTCIGEDGVPQEPCTRYNCTKLRKLQRDNTCTYEGSEYRCLKDNIIPYMNGKFADGDAAFALHVGDIIKGDKFASNKRCSDASFESRQNLFNQCSNLLLVPGDNEWND